MGSENREPIVSFDSRWAGRPIRPGSCWQRKADGRLLIVVPNSSGTAVFICFGDDTYKTADFRAAFEWVADPALRREEP